MNTTPVARLVLLCLSLLTGALAQPVGGGGGGTKQVCGWEQFAVPVVTGWTPQGFPIMHMELQWRYVCHAVPA